MRRNRFWLITFLVLTWTSLSFAAKDLEIKGKELISQKPPFAFTLPSELRLIHSFSHDNPEENSVTRVYFLITEKNRQVEEMLILQIADRTNPQAEPIRAPALKPYTEKRMYLKDKKKKGALEVDYLLQLMAWNPDASSLQPIRRKGINIPSCWAMQGQFLFNYLGEHVVLVRYSRDVNAYGLKVSETAENWNKGSISSHEQRVYEAFRRGFLEMVDSIQIKSH
ncbi:MAG: hypothetical protein ACUVWO_13965 [Thermodesulfobacteriota bacterium]